MEWVGRRGRAAGLAAPGAPGQLLIGVVEQLFVLWPLMTQEKQFLVASKDLKHTDLKKKKKSLGCIQLCDLGQVT